MEFYHDLVHGLLIQVWEYMVATVFTSRFQIDQTNFKDLNIVSFSPCIGPKKKDWNQNNSRM